MDPSVLKTYEASLARCDQNPVFLDRFYEVFLASSPRVAEKFANTDFTGQKRALRESLNSMLMAAADPDHPEQYLHDIAQRHSSRQLAVGAEFYDYWLDSLLATVKECDPQFDARVQQAWEYVMMHGISYLLSKY